MNTNTNTNTNTNANARARAIERARANEWEHGLNEEAAELTGDDRAEALFSLCYCQGDGVALETTATIRRLDQGQPLEFTGLARRVWEGLTGYAEIEAALDYAEERAAEEWDAEHGAEEAA